MGKTAGSKFETSCGTKLAVKRKKQQILRECLEVEINYQLKNNLTHQQVNYLKQHQHKMVEVSRCVDDKVKSYYRHQVGAVDAMLVKLWRRKGDIDYKFFTDVMLQPELHRFCKNQVANVLDFLAKKQHPGILHPDRSLIVRIEKLNLESLTNVIDTEVTQQNTGSTCHSETQIKTTKHRSLMSQGKQGSSAPEINEKKKLKKTTNVQTNHTSVHTNHTRKCNKELLENVRKQIWKKKRPESMVPKQLKDISKVDKHKSAKDISKDISTVDKQRNSNDKECKNLFERMHGSKVEQDRDKFDEKLSHPGTQDRTDSKSSKHPSAQRVSLSSPKQKFLERNEIKNPNEKKVSNVKEGNIQPSKPVRMLQKPEQKNCLRSDNENAKAKEKNYITVKEAMQSKVTKPIDTGESSLALNTTERNDGESPTAEENYSNVVQSLQYKSMDTQESSSDLCLKSEGVNKKAEESYSTGSGKESMPMKSMDVQESDCQISDDKNPKAKENYITAEESVQTKPTDTQESSLAKNTYEPNDCLRSDGEKPKAKESKSNVKETTHSEPMDIEESSLAVNTNEPKKDCLSSDSGNPKANESVSSLEESAQSKPMDTQESSSATNTNGSTRRASSQQMSQNGWAPNRYTDKNKLISVLESYLQNPGRKRESPQKLKKSLKKKAENESRSGFKKVCLRPNREESRNKSVHCRGDLPQNSQTLKESSRLKQPHQSSSRVAFPRENSEFKKLSWKANGDENQKDVNIPGELSLKETPSSSSVALLRQNSESKKLCLRPNEGEIQHSISNLGKLPGGSRTLKESSRVKHQQQSSSSVALLKQKSEVKQCSIPNEENEHKVNSLRKLPQGSQTLKKSSRMNQTHQSSSRMVLSRQNSEKHRKPHVIPSLVSQQTQPELVERRLVRQETNPKEISEILDDVQSGVSDTESIPTDSSQETSPEKRRLSTTMENLLTIPEDSVRPSIVAGSDVVVNVHQNDPGLEAISIAELEATKITIINAPGEQWDEVTIDSLIESTDTCPTSQAQNHALVSDHCSKLHDIREKASSDHQAHNIGKHTETALVSSTDRPNDLDQPVVTGQASTDKPCDTNQQDSSVNPCDTDQQGKDPASSDNPCDIDQEVKGQSSLDYPCETDQQANDQASLHKQCDTEPREKNPVSFDQTCDTDQEEKDQESSENQCDGHSQANNQESSDQPCDTNTPLERRVSVTRNRSQETGLVPRGTNLDNVDPGQEDISVRTRSLYAEKSFEGDCEEVNHERVQPEQCGLNSDQPSEENYLVNHQKEPQSEQCGLNSDQSPEVDLQAHQTETQSEQCYGSSNISQESQLSTSFQQLESSQQIASTTETVNQLSQAQSKSSVESTNVNSFLHKMLSNHLSSDTERLTSSSETQVTPADTQTTVLAERNSASVNVNLDGLQNMVNRHNSSPVYHYKRRSKKENRNPTFVVPKQQCRLPLSIAQSFTHQPPIQHMVYPVQQPPHALFYQQSGPNNGQQPDPNTGLQLINQISGSQPTYPTNVPQPSQYGTSHQSNGPQLGLGSSHLSTRPSSGYPSNGPQTGQPIAGTQMSPKTNSRQPGQQITDQQLGEGIAGTHPGNRTNAPQPPGYPNTPWQPAGLPVTGSSSQPFAGLTSGPGFVGQSGYQSGSPSSSYQPQPLGRQPPRYPVQNSQELGNTGSFDQGRHNLHNSQSRRMSGDNLNSSQSRRMSGDSQSNPRFSTPGVMTQQNLPNQNMWQNHMRQMDLQPNMYNQTNTSQNMQCQAQYGTNTYNQNQSGNGYQNFQNSFQQNNVSSVQQNPYSQRVPFMNYPGHSNALQSQINHPGQTNVPQQAANYMPPHFQYNNYQGGGPIPQSRRHHPYQSHQQSGSGLRQQGQQSQHMGTGPRQPGHQSQHMGARPERQGYNTDPLFSPDLFKTERQFAKKPKETLQNCVKMFQQIIKDFVNSPRLRFEIATVVQENHNSCPIHLILEHLNKFKQWTDFCTRYRAFSRAKQNFLSKLLQMVLYKIDYNISSDDMVSPKSNLTESTQASDVVGSSTSFSQGGGPQEVNCGMNASPQQSQTMLSNPVMANNNHTQNRAKSPDVQITKCNMAKRSHTSVKREDGEPQSKRRSIGESTPETGSSTPETVNQVTAIRSTGTNQMRPGTNETETRMSSSSNVSHIVGTSTGNNNNDTMSRHSSVPPGVIVIAPISNPDDIVYPHINSSVVSSHVPHIHRGSPSSSNATVQHNNIESNNSVHPQNSHYNTGPTSSTVSSEIQDVQRDSSSSSSATVLQNDTGSTTCSVVSSQVPHIQRGSSSTTLRQNNTGSTTTHNTHTTCSVVSSQVPHIQRGSSSSTTLRRNNTESTTPTHPQDSQNNTHTTCSVVSSQVPHIQRGSSSSTTLRRNNTESTTPTHSQNSQNNTSSVVSSQVPHILRDSPTVQQNNAESTNSVHTQLDQNNTCPNSSINQNITSVNSQISYSGSSATALQNNTENANSVHSQLDLNNTSPNSAESQSTSENSQINENSSGSSRSISSPVPSSATPSLSPQQTVHKKKTRPNILRRVSYYDATAETMKLRTETSPSTSASCGTTNTSDSAYSGNIIISQPCDTGGDSVETIVEDNDYSIFNLDVETFFKLMNANKSGQSQAEARDNNSSVPTPSPQEPPERSFGKHENNTQTSEGTHTQTSERPPTQAYERTPPTQAYERTHTQISERTDTQASEITPTQASEITPTQASERTDTQTSERTHTQISKRTDTQTSERIHTQTFEKAHTRTHTQTSERTLTPERSAANISKEDHAANDQSSLRATSPAENRPVSSADSVVFISDDEDNTHPDGIVDLTECEETLRQSEALQTESSPLTISDTEDLQSSTSESHPPETTMDDSRSTPSGLNRDSSQEFRKDSTPDSSSGESVRSSERTELQEMDRSGNLSLPTDTVEASERGSGEISIVDHAVETGSMEISTVDNARETGSMEISTLDHATETGFMEISTLDVLTEVGFIESSTAACNSRIDEMVKISAFMDDTLSDSASEVQCPAYSDISDDEIIPQPSECIQPGLIYSDISDAEPSRSSEDGHNVDNASKETPAYTDLVASTSKVCGSEEKMTELKNKAVCISDKSDSNELDPCTQKGHKSTKVSKSSPGNIQTDQRERISQNTNPKALVSPPSLKNFSKQQLMTYLERKHKLFTCKCGMKFLEAKPRVNSTHLMIHKMSHSNDSKLSCSTCHESCYSVAGLIKHWISLCKQKDRNEPACKYKWK